MPQDLRVIFEESVHEVAKKQRRRTSKWIKILRKIQGRWVLCVQELTLDEVKAFKKKLNLFMKNGKKVGDEVVDKWLTQLFLENKRRTSTWKKTKLFIFLDKTEEIILVGMFALMVCYFYTSYNALYI